MPWQQAAADVALEYDPVTGLLRYDEVDITVPRQSGKTTLTLAKKVHRLTVMARRQGPQRSTYVAQSRLKARKKLEMDFAQALRGSRSFREITNPKGRPQTATQWRLSLNNGSECMQFGLGSFLQIDAPSRTGGHGDTLDDGTIDEAFSQEDDTVEAGMRPSMATRRNAQLWVISTAGDARSAYLYRKVLAGRAACKSGRHGRVCYIEYSADEDADPGDPRTWWSCMPALGITITEEFIRGEWDRAQRKGPEGIKTFLRAYLNLWPDPPSLTDAARGTALDLGAWSLVGGEVDRGSNVVFGVDVDADRVASVCVAWRTPQGVHGELASEPVPAHELPARCAELVSRWGGRVAAPPALVEDLQRHGVPLLEVKPSAWPLACGTVVDMLAARTLSHGNQAPLNDAAKVVQWTPTSSTGSRSFRLKDSPGAGPFFAFVRAVHTAATLPSVYEEREPVWL